jgi:1-acyl-sn-glycerol-3-phosphate acyltransferase
VSHTGLPRTTDLPHPPTALLHRGRPPARHVVRRIWAVEVHGADRVPVTGPVVFAANHIGFLDGPLLAICAPRPVHALTKIEMFAGGLGGVLRASGQIPVRRGEPDIAAVRTSVRVLRDGGVVGIFPEGTRGPGDVAAIEPGAAYLALVTGATVVPVAFLGSRLPGASLSSLPPRGSRIAMTFGEPVTVAAQPWPRRRADVAATTGRIRAAMLETLRVAQATTGMGLPGPAPEGEIEE